MLYRTTTAPLLRPLLICTMLLGLLVAGAAFAQATQETQETDETAATQVAGENGQDQDPDEETVSGEIDETLGVAAFGISAGFPAYQTVAGNFSVQVEHFGIAFRAAYTGNAGIYAGIGMRGYPPIPGLPVPVFAELGAGVHRGGFAPYAAVGSHVPLSQNMRLDIQAGAARVPLLDSYNTAPFLSVGVSYAFAFDPSELSADVEDLSPVARERIRRSSGYVPDCGLEPDPGQLSRAVSDTVEGFLRDARASYGSLYRNLKYNYSTSRSVNGDSATVTVSYSGSVIERATGDRVSASGKAKISFRWNGCGWQRTSLEY